MKKDAQHMEEEKEENLGNITYHVRKATSSGKSKNIWWLYSPASALLLLHFESVPGFSCDGTSEISL